MAIEGNLELDDPIGARNELRKEKNQMSEAMNGQEYILFATKLAREAGKIALEGRKEKIVSYQFKSSHKDLVTEIDRQVERFIVAKIKETYPSHGILGEEGTNIDGGGNSSYRWVIDPIDGTTNFIHQGINFCVSIALYQGGEGVAGVVYDPSRDELFSGERGKGAFLNGSRIGFTGEKKMDESLIGTNLIWVGRTRRLKLEESIYRLANVSRGVRSLGAAALELAYVAAGRLDAYLGLYLSPWDYGAGKLIVEEAGGKVSNFDGDSLSLISEKQGLLASHPSIHGDLLQFLKRE
ncbi:Inositol-1-monophosphatase [[Clostridium] ultunense Esp]|nr:Inositol-1-monophosphatase [[Clostridium] ultunense Esp]